VLLEVRSDSVVVDSLVMSCRAMGRGIETVIANRLKAIARVLLPRGRLSGEFRPTAKNMPAADFYARQGFVLEAEDGDGNQRYGLAVAEAVDVPCPAITVEQPKIEGVTSLEPQAG
jgi:predicted enzyme involved in methoxymalonyl-ACP biosynthesis